MTWPNPKLGITGLVITLGSLFPIYQVVVVNPSEDLFKNFLNVSHIRNYNGGMSETTFSLVWGFMTAILNGGALVGVFVAPALTERIGRKNTLLLNHIPNVIGILLICVSRKIYSIEMFAVGRFIVGFNCGVANGVIGLFLTEISPFEVRGQMGSLQETCFSLICATGMIVGIPDILGTDEHIYILIALPLIPSTIQFVFLLFIPETPKHLLLTMLDEKGADKSLLFYHGPKVNLAEVKTELRKEKELQTGESMSVRQCFSDPHIRRGFLIGIVANMAAVLTGITAVFFFSTDIFYRAGVPLKVAKFSTVAMTILNFVATSLSSGLLVERFGRRPLLLISLGGCLVCHITFVVFSEIGQNLGLTWPPYIAVIAIIFHVVMFSIGAGPLAWFLTTELVPQAGRSKAQAFATGSQWVGAMIDGMGFYPLFCAIGPYALLITSVLPTSIFITILFLYMPESRGKDVNTIFDEYDAKRLKSEKPLDITAIAGL